MAQIRKIQLCHITVAEFVVIVQINDCFRFICIELRFQISVAKEEV